MNSDGAKYIRFETNIAQLVALKYANGKPAPARQEGYSDQVMFTTVDGRILYLPLFAADLIVNSGIQPGEEFKIGKFEIREGQARRIRWKLERIAPDPEDQLAADLRRSAELATAAARQGTAPNWDQLRASSVHSPVPAPPRRVPVQATPPAPASRSTPAPATPIHAVPQRPATGANPSPTPTAPMPRANTGNGTSTAPPPQTKVPFEAAFTEFLVSAGRATRKAEQILGADGGSVRFDSRDVAAIATTLFISADKRNWITGIPE